MRYFKLLLTILMITFSLKGSAQQHYGNLTGFEILSSYLDNGKVKVNDAAATTTVQFTASFTRQTDIYPNWKYFSMSVVLGTIKNGVPTFFSGAQTITNSDFSSGNAFLTKTFSSTITKSLLLSGQKIMLFYQTPQMSQPGYYTSKLYDFILFGSPPVDPPVDPPVEGSIAIYSMVKIGGGTHSLSKTPTNDGVWNNEGLAFYAHAIQDPGTVPIYKHYGVYPSGLGTFLYDRNQFPDPWWTYVGIAFYAFATQVPGTVPVWCYTNSVGSDHFFSADYQGDPYWVKKYIAFYAYPKS